ncbi:S-layer homology domain-containing protein [Heliomicrobium modesticaldum]|uniref:S-layer homology domain-containing protein n=1 Tax=Heliomicrobium modesticaldum TaxID=35701 RepID=UPI0002FE6B18|nr:S-layer homology domain-containing protein [Heliomicrobium modesticaldum]
MRKRLLFFTTLALVTLGAGMAEAGDIRVRFEDVERPGVWSPVAVQSAGTMTSENLSESVPRVNFGDNQTLRSVFLVAPTEGPQSVGVGSRITVTLPFGIEYMQVPTAERLDKYVSCPSMINWLVNAITTEGDRPAFRLVSATPRSLTVEIANMRPTGVPFVEFTFHSKDLSMVRVSEMVTWSDRDGKFSDGMTRQEFFSYFIDVSPSLKQIEESVKGEEAEQLRSFTDADKTKPELQGRLAGLVKQNLVIGRPGHRLAPDAPITRAEAVTLVSRAQQWDNPSTPTFADMENSWAWGPVSAATVNGLAKGYPDGTFRPENPIAREEAFLLLERLYDNNVSRK